MNGKSRLQGPLAPPPGSDGDPTATIATDPRRPPAEVPLRHVHRQRGFGVGYGNSSGYDDGRHYIDGHADPMFRCI